MAKDTIIHYISFDVAPGGTFNVPYPPGRVHTDYNDASTDHLMVADGGVYRESEGKVAFSFAMASHMVVTNNTGRTLKRRTRVLLDIVRI